MAKKDKGRAWDLLRRQKPLDTVRHRDVYESQQLERSTIAEPQTPTSRIIAALIATLFFAMFMWLLISGIQFGAASVRGSNLNGNEGTTTEHSSTVKSPPTKYAERMQIGMNDPADPSQWVHRMRYVPINEDGTLPVDTYGRLLKGTVHYENYEDVPVPDWYEDAKVKYETHLETEGGQAASKDDSESGTFLSYMAPNKVNVIGTLLSALVFYSFLHQILMRNLEAQNMMSSTSDINQYQNDQHIALPQEIQRKYDWFPDVGATSNVQVSSMISHMMLTNKGIDKVPFSKRAEEDIHDEDGDIIYYKGEVLTDDNGQPVTEMVPLFDTQFAKNLFVASDAPKDTWHFYDTVRIPYNPENKNREKLKGYDMVSDLINNDWHLPWYEPQRPAGAYIVDTEPVNTMILAITRAGKGQTVIEPTIDMWLRERRPNNIIINDPKGELLVKNYVKSTVRGFHPVQFNLINVMKTDIYNPLLMAAESAREGDFMKCAIYVENIADVFFPLDGGEDPVWPNAANNAFKRAAYGLIDYYLEEERELRLFAEETGMDARVLETKLDELWGKVTLYNCYQLFVQLTSKKLKNPAVVFAKQAKDHEFDDLPNEEYEEMLEEVEAKAQLWEEKPEIDLLTLYFNATKRLPKNQMRTLIDNADSSLRSMSGAEKMMASVYGIAITAMSFFTDPTISTLTSGAPSQNVDLAGLSFPRRIGVRFATGYLKRYHLIGLQAKWQAFSDPEFKESLGKEFYHEDMVRREGWARYYFKGVFPTDEAYIRLQIVNPSTRMLVKSFYFSFQKSYQTSLDARTYVKDPILDTKIVKNGILQELLPVESEDGTVTYKRGHVTFPSVRMKDIDTMPRKENVKAHAIVQSMVRYSEKPKVVFLVTPPHLMKYAKLILILIKQLVDLNFDQSYMTKSDQKPLYKTRFMLDELGNLQSEGHGISGFETMLSIGLGQEQQFTLILQTLQQLRDVYGDSVDKIVQGNAQPLSALIATPTGWQTMGDTKVGDKVLTPDGGIATVAGVYPRGVRPVYKVSLRDGSSTEVCNEHLWEIERYKTKLTYLGVDEDGKRQYGRGENGKTCELVSEVINTDELKERVEKGRQINLPKIKPLAYEVKDLPIHPYVLGVLLGDAHIDFKGSAYLTCYDQEILDRLVKLGYELTENALHTYYVKGVSNDLRALGLDSKLSYEKFVPEMYLYGSVDQRVDLLRGLMDSDGYISKANEMEFVSTSEQLALDVQQLVRSLGGRVSVNVKKKVMYTSPNQKVRKQARPAYRVQNIRLYDINPFYLSRKAERWLKRDDNAGNRVVDVRYLRDEEVQCIMIDDERHLYITDDFIPTHNTSNIVFLKSTDDSMIDTLQKMSGTTHTTYTDSKTITRDMEKLFMKNEGKTSYTMTTREEPVIKYNDMAFISPRNSIIFRAGDSPIWNRNETILPMSWRLFQNTIIHPGHSYTLQTIPTLSTAKDFDVRKNQPDFDRMLDKRMSQAIAAMAATEVYQSIYGYTDYQIEQLDPDDYASEIMEVINISLRDDLHDNDDPWGDEYDEFLHDEAAFAKDIEVNEEQAEATAAAQASYQVMNEKRFANGFVAPSDLVSMSGGTCNHSLDKTIIAVYTDIKGDMWRDDDYFMTKGDGNLYSIDGECYIRKLNQSADLERLNDAAKDDDTRVFAEDEVTADDVKAIGSFEVTDAFLKFLASQPSWDFANGKFDAEMARRLRDE